MTGMVLFVDFSIKSFRTITKTRPDAPKFFWALAKTIAYCNKRENLRIDSIFSFYFCDVERTSEKIRWHIANNRNIAWDNRRYVRQFDSIDRFIWTIIEICRIFRQFPRFFGGNILINISFWHNPIDLTEFLCFFRRFFRPITSDEIIGALRWTQIEKIQWNGTELGRCTALKKQHCIRFRNRSKNLEQLLKTFFDSNEQNFSNIAFGFLNNFGEGRWSMTQF